MSNPDPYATPTGPTGPAVPTGPRRLTRAMDDRKVSGVCGGLARYANVDATLVRVLVVVASVLLFPVPILIYLLLWLIIPTT